MAGKTQTPKRRRKLSRSEWVVMNHCWQLGQVTARQVWEASADHRDWNYQTVKTMLDRIVDKGYLSMHKVGPVCVFSPAVPRSTALSAAVEDFVATVFDGTLQPFFSHLVQSGRMSEEELESLRRSLDAVAEDPADGG